MSQTVKTQGGRCSCLSTATKDSYNDFYKGRKVTTDTYLASRYGKIKLKKGEMTDAPVKTQFGYHVIRVDDTRDAKAPEAPKFEDVKAQVKTQMEQQKLAKFQEDLRAKAKIE